MENDSLAQTQSRLFQNKYTLGICNNYEHYMQMYEHLRNQIMFVAEKTHNMCTIIFNPATR